MAVTKLIYEKILDLLLDSENEDMFRKKQDLIANIRKYMDNASLILAEVDKLIA